ncbi:CLUMA_CG008763, isoform A [Clunio marinus]|uniref:CLUMA_CG008763, isoform A n=1 Tax=Clunio marinus TaxID=568069 RepID=A0A1J1I4M7_9DIPT|nr:CLUMA_CG008763, isoform A [Clunio marinus]
MVLSRCLKEEKKNLISILKVNEGVQCSYVFNKRPFENMMIRNCVYLQSLQYSLSDEEVDSNEITAKRKKFAEDSGLYGGTWNIQKKILNLHLIEIGWVLLKFFGPLTASLER